MNNKNAVDWFAFLVYQVVQDVQITIGVLSQLASSKQIGYIWDDYHSMLKTLSTS
eukprot:CAMPEP_0114363262 /NCGR_PEP_ID=MMETSP0101-20121206/26429_1 /TAXON_ID=38822 ORGANISM="Pteridomonas danica, Strain PT" /NCGR_SAMPLE_ID=MMETSP0101 /ASSEMBLY_ACC=CAM_ASM_000211 /LENGTH=54 /DNA_ID=CAMNT_0001509805 /DNA_START=1 /DNA_END=162 /DNA_ORIENTATION=-